MSEFIQIIPSNIFKIFLILIALIFVFALIPQLSFSMCWMSATSQTSKLVKWYAEGPFSGEGAERTVTYGGCVQMVKFASEKTMLADGIAISSCPTGYKSFVYIVPEIKWWNLFEKSKEPRYACYGLNRPFGSFGGIIDKETVNGPGARKEAQVTYCIKITPEKDTYSVSVEVGECKKA